MGGDGQRNLQIIKNILSRKTLNNNNCYVTSAKLPFKSSWNNTEILNVKLITLIIINWWTTYGKKKATILLHTCVAFLTSRISTEITDP